MQNMRNTKMLLNVDQVVPSYADAEQEKRSEREPSNMERNGKFYINPEKERKLLLKFDVFPRE